MLEVLTPTGVRFTRKGHLSVSSEGELVTDQGYRVLNALTTPAGSETQAQAQDPKLRTIRVPMNSPVTISLEGVITSQNNPIAQLSVVEFQDRHALRKEGQALFINTHPENIKRENARTAVIQGSLEGSNVNAIHEMSELIKAHRQFDSIQKAIQTYDNIQGRAVNDIAKY
jgi:flagellar basal-body rod protein FlgG